MPMFSVAQKKTSHIRSVYDEVWSTSLTDVKGNPREKTPEGECPSITEPDSPSISNG